MTEEEKALALGAVNQSPKEEPKELTQADHILVDILARSHAVVDELNAARLPPHIVEAWRTTTKPERLGPGHVNFMTGMTHAAQCAAKIFDDEDPEAESIDTQLNVWSEGPGLGMLIAEARALGPNRLLVFFTKRLTDSEVRKHQDAAREIEAMLQERDAKNRELTEAAEKQEILELAEKVKRQKEARQLELDMIERGRRCEKNHGHLIEEKRKERKGK